MKNKRLKTLVLATSLLGAHGYASGQEEDKVSAFGPGVPNVSMPNVDMRDPSVRTATLVGAVFGLSALGLGVGVAMGAGVTAAERRVKKSIASRKSKASKMCP